MESTHTPIQEESEETESYINYPNKLLKIETRQQFKQLNIFKNGRKELQENLVSEVNKSISRVLKLNEEHDDKFSIELPMELEEKISDKIRKKITKELSGNEVRVLTAILGLAQLAKSRTELAYIEQLDRAYFEFSIQSLFKFMGLSRNVGKKHRDLVRKALQNLHHKEFLIPVTRYDANRRDTGRGFMVKKLVEIHEFLDFEKEGSKVLKVTVDSCFFDFQYNKNNTYFNIPADLNKRLRSVSVGRPNVGIELFIKCLYQAIHCSKSNVVEYSYPTLINIMRLDKHKKNGNQGRIKPTIEKALNIAQKLNLISNIKEGRTQFGELKYVLTLK